MRMIPAVKTAHRYFFLKLFRSDYFITCIGLLAEGPGGEVINPPKTFEEVNKEAFEGHELYIASHNDYFVGE